MQQAEPLGDVNGDGVADFYLNAQPRGRIIFGGSGIQRQGSLSAGGGQLSFISPSRIWNIHGVGDINLDGIDDLMVIRHSPVSSSPFIREIVFGDAEWQFTGEVRQVSLHKLDPVRLHSSVEAARPLGDLDADGRTDYLIRSDSRHYVLTGAPDRMFRLRSGLHPENGLPGHDHNDLAALFPVGDVNADGFDDLIVRRPVADRDAQAFLIFGGHEVARQLGESAFVAASWDDIGELASLMLPNVHRSPMFRAGDVNGDGVNDIITDGYVLYGGEQLSMLDTFQPSGLDGLNGLRWTPMPRLPFGPSDLSQQLFNVADINGDGFDDLFTNGGMASDDYPYGVAGPTYVHYGAPAESGIEPRQQLVDGRHGFTIETDRYGQYHWDYGISLITDDYNADGVDDIVIVDSTEPHAGTGTLQILWGSPSGIVSGSGPLESTISLPPGARVTYRVEGVVRADLVELGSARVSIQLGDGQQPLSQLLLSDSLQTGSPNADLDGDGSVGFADFLILADSYGRDDATADDGDLNGDGRVDFADFLLLQDRYGQG